MFHTKGQLAEYAKLSVNTVTVWVREGVIVPNEKTGRNNQFSREELILARILAVPYHDLGIGSDVLSEIADHLRPVLNFAKDMGFKGYADAKLAYDKNFFARFVKTRADEVMQKAGENRETAEITIKHLADEVGVKDWENSEPFLSEDQEKSLNAYNKLMECVEGQSGGYITMAMSADGDWLMGFSFHDSEEDDSGHISAKIYVPPVQVRSMVLIDLKSLFA